MAGAAASKRAESVRKFEQTTAWNAAMAADIHNTVAATRKLIERSRQILREADRLLTDGRPP